MTSYRFGNRTIQGVQPGRFAPSFVNLYVKVFLVTDLVTYV